MPRANTSVARSTEIDFSLQGKFFVGQTKLDKQPFRNVDHSRNFTGTQALAGSCAKHMDF